jgi:hypothetical protein
LFLMLSVFDSIHLLFLKMDDAQTHFGLILCMFWACNGLVQIVHRVDQSPTYD